MRGINSGRWISLLLGVLLIIGGILTITDPLESILSLIEIIGVLLIIVGIFKIIRYFTDTILMNVSVLFSGIIDFALGVLILYNLPTSLSLFRIFMGFWVFFNGLTEVAVSIDFRKNNINSWRFGLISGALGFIIGLFILLNVQLSFKYIAAMIAFYLIILGVSFIATFIELTRISNLVDFDDWSDD